MLVEGEATTFRCPHVNQRLIPGIYHDGVFDKAMADVHIIKAKAKDSGEYACDYGDKKDNKVKLM